MPKKERIQQFHFSPKSARENVNKSINEAHGMLSRDYQGMKVAKVRLAKKVSNGPNVAVNGRRLYNIYLERS